jgi:carbon-monoxide dehydrogenase medium subunit
MKPSSFEYLRPESLDDALRMMAAHGPHDGKPLAGGQSLIPMMNFRVAAPALLIDLNRIGELAGVREEETDIVIGAMTRHNDVKTHPLVLAHAPLIAEAYEHVAHFTVRNRGTLGGNLVHADPASEMPMVMLALDARMTLRSVRGSREIPAAEFFLGTYTTAIEEDELLVEIRAPKRERGARHAVEEVSLRKGDFAMSAVAIALTMDEAAICRNVRIALAGVSDVQILAEDAAAIIEGRGLDAGIINQTAQAVMDSIEFLDSVTVSADYKRDLTLTLTRRCLHRIQEHRP